MAKTINRELIKIEEIEKELKMARGELIEKSLRENLEAGYFKELEAEHNRLLPKMTEQDWFKYFSKPDLKNKLTGLIKEKKELRQEIKNNLFKLYKTSKSELSVWISERLLEAGEGKKLNQLSIEIQRIKWLLSPNITYSKNKITDAMKQKAKDYPFEQLIKFNRARKAICMFHSDKHPSLSLNPKTNRIRCFSCGASFDTIGYIMTTQNASFIETIKYLNNY
jgi:hypothetical protein